MSPPRVFAAVPTRGHEAQVMQGHFALPTAGGALVVPGSSRSSLLAHGFNVLWATALAWQKAGAADYFLLHHDDVEVRTPGWLDVMLAEMTRVGAAVLSAVVPIKNGTGETSTAVETRCPWNPRRLTLAECLRLPRTFSGADVGGQLLVNTGLMLVNLSRPEWHETVSMFEFGVTTEELRFKFQIRDRIVPRPDGILVAEVRPEDWEFSRECNGHGLPVFATTAVRLIHHGGFGWPNYAPDGEENVVHA